MKKNYSQQIIHPNAKERTIGRTASKQQTKEIKQSKIKTFTRKPASGYVSSSKKQLQASIDQPDSNRKISNFQELIEKSKKVKFISCRSQSSLCSSVVSTSSFNISLDQSFNDKNDIEISVNSRFNLEQSIIPQIDEQEEGYQQPLIRKTKKSSFLVRRKNINASMMETSTTRSRNERKLDKDSEQTKLESSEISQVSRTFRRPSTNIMNLNILRNSKNSSKQSMRKSNSSNSLIKRQPKKCSQCELYQSEIRQLISKNERLQRILKNKDQEITEISKKLSQSEKKNMQLEKKFKAIQREDLESKCKILEEQLILCQQSCNKITETYMKTAQELKYKTIENTTLKKYQTQSQSIERKVQMLVAERNQLRQRLSKLKAIKRSSVLNYPSSFGKQHKSQSNSRISHSDRNLDSYSMNGQQYEQDEFFQEEIQSANNYRVKTTGNGFIKKSAFIKAYDDSSESELISLSEDLEQYNY